MYCDQADLVKRFGETELVQLTDREFTGVINTDIVMQAISDASAIIDGYIAGRVTLPFTSVPRVINTLCGDIARYRLHDESPSEQVVKGYDNAIKFFEHVAAGKVSLGLTVEGDATASNNLSQMQSAGSVFSREKSKDFI